MRAWKRLVVAGAIALAITLSSVRSARADIPLGIVIQDTPAGVVVTDVVIGGIADRCMPRLRPGARIVTVNGSPVTSAEGYRQIVACSDFVRFEFIDATGELRWARAWNGGRILPRCKP
jgi:S1-C subfamily serine protease